jgi:hypothetical protein
MKRPVQLRFQDMTTYTKHALERRGQREINPVYVELCLREGNDFAHDDPCLNKTCYHGLTVISKPFKKGKPPTIVTCYWECDPVTASDTYDKLLKQRKTEFATNRERRRSSRKSGKHSFDY